MYRTLLQVLIRTLKNPTYESNLNRNQLGPLHLAVPLPTAFNFNLLQNNPQTYSSTLKTLNVTSPLSLLASHLAHSH
ncbi:hypothetical protein M758_1G222000 [Ceratodon purpureus]|nr:hypothetical protein M758_1G222000 [Ceratodon purpureus]